MVGVQSILVEFMLSEGRVVLNTKRECNQIAPVGAPTLLHCLAKEFEFKSACFTRPGRLSDPSLYPYHLTQSLSMLGPCTGEDSSVSYSRNTTGFRRTGR